MPSMIPSQIFPNQPKVFRDSIHEYYWKLKQLYPHLQHACNLTSTRTKSSSSTDTKHQSLNGTSRGTQPANGTSRGTPPANGTSRAIPPANGTSRATPPANGTSRATPPANGTSTATPPANGTSRATPPANGTNRATPPANGTSRGTPSGNGTSRGTLSANDTNRGTPSAYGTIREVPSVNATNSGTPPLYGTSREASSVSGINNGPSLYGISREAPSVNGTNKGTPSAYGTSREAPSVSGTNKGTPSAYGTSRESPSGNGTRKGTPSAYGTSREAPSRNGTNKGTPSAYGTSREAPSGNGTRKGTPSAYGTSREAPSGNGTNKGTPSAYGTSRFIEATSSSRRGTLLSSGDTAIPRTFSSSCVSLAAGSTVRDSIATSLAPSSSLISTPLVSAPNNSPFQLSSAKATINSLGGIHSSSEPRAVVSLSSLAAVPGMCRNTNASLMVRMSQYLMRHSGAATGDVPKQKRRRIRRKSISSKVVVEKKKKVHETMRSPQDVQNSLDCSVREVVLPEVTPLSVPAAVVAWLPGSSVNAKKKKGWQKFKEKRKARILERQKTNPSHACSPIQENQDHCVGSCTGLDAEDPQQTRPTNSGARRSYQIGGCVSLANDVACLSTKKVTFALNDASSVSKSVDRQKTGDLPSSPCDSKYSSERIALIRKSGLTFPKNHNSPITQQTSNSTILLDCSYNNLNELSPETVVTTKSNQMSLAPLPNLPSSTKQRVVSIPPAKPLRNYTMEPISSLNTLSQTAVRQGVHFGLLAKNKSSTSCENGSPNQPHNLTYPSVMECSSDSSTSSSDTESVNPLATSSQIMGVPSFKRKVETTYFVASKKVKPASMDKTLGPDVCYLTSITKNYALPGCVHLKKLHFSTEDPGLSVLQASSSSMENFSSSSASSSSVPSVISGTPSPVDTTRKKVSFVPRSSQSGSGVLMGKESKREPTTPLKHTHKGSILQDLEVIETRTSLLKNRTLSAKTRGIVTVDLEPGTNCATRSGSRTSTLCEDSVIGISVEAKSSCGHSKTTPTATLACSKKGSPTTCEDVNNNSDERCELTCIKDPIVSNEEEASFSTVDMLCSEDLERSVSCQNITSQDVVMSEESTCLEQSLFVVPHECRRLNKPKGKPGSCRIEFLENSIDLAL